MPLLNYTTTVAAGKTVGEVHALLVKAGARQIATEYDQAGEPTAIAFTTETATGRRAFTLPVHTDRVLAVMKRQRVAPRYLTPEQAQRVAWRIVKDWCEAQLAIIQTDMAALDQVMLPYMRAGSSGETVYELYLGQQLALPSGIHG